MKLLWDLLRPSPKRKRVARRRPLTRREGPAAARYERLTAAMLERYGVRVRRWRRSTSGVAMLVRAPGGRIERWIESPQPRGPVSAAVFLHEIGHHALGVGSISPRCLEEHQAWAFSLAAMRAEGISVTASVEGRVRSALAYAMAKAARRGIKRIPAEVAPYLDDPDTAPLPELLAEFEGVLAAPRR